VALVARAHGVNANQIFKGRWAFERGELSEAGVASAGLFPVRVSAFVPLDAHILRAARLSPNLVEAKPPRIVSIQVQECAEQDDPRSSAKYFLRHSAPGQVQLMFDN
jgi:transposase-like protein